MVQKLLDAVTGVGAGVIIKPLGRGNNEKENQGVFQVDFGAGSGTVALEGRADPAAPWVAGYTTNASGIQPIQLMNEMRANVTIYGSGAISAWLDI